MKSLILKSIVAISATVFSSQAFAQSVAKPGQIAPAPEALFASLPSSVTSPVKAKNSFLSAEERHDRKMNRIWLTSIAAMVAATSMDAGSSWGKLEGNSFLASSDGRFGAKGLSIKAGVAAGVIIPQVLLRHRKDLKSKFAIGNFAEAALFGGIAARNMGISR
jgi:hypothetical protein